MGSRDEQLRGPDLAAGIEAASVPDGGMVTGHAGGEAVLLARRGEEWFAVGATCTHYGGPLGDGLVSDCIVRCPWHHARFDLRTGAAVEAPALTALPCFRVEREGGRVFVRGEPIGHEDRLAGNLPLPGPSAATDVRRVVVVGAGAAGAAAAEMLRREGFDGELTLVGDETHAPYDRPNLSKDYLAGTAPEEWIPLRPREHYSRHRIDTLLGTGAARLDRAARAVVLADGRALPYDRLVLATGAAPVRLRIPGAQQPHVSYLRSLDDSRALVAALPHVRRAVVLGASFIGLEVAASLRTRGIEVHVVGPEDRPLARVLGDALGDAVREIHEAHGVIFHLGRTASTIHDDSVTLSDGARIAAEHVVVGIGVRPRTELAEEAGLDVDGGILVDDRLRTSDARIYAAGDAARFPLGSGDRVRIEHWVVAQRQGQTAARNILGGDVAFRSVPFFWSMHYDVAVSYVGYAAGWDRVDADGDPRAQDCAVAFRRGGRTLAVATIGRDRTSLEAEVAMEHGDEDRLRALVPPSGV